jgi:hypothetical protein
VDDARSRTSFVSTADTFETKNDAELLPLPKAPVKHAVTLRRPKEIDIVFAIQVDLLSTRTRSDHDNATGEEC